MSKKKYRIYKRITEDNKPIFFIKEKDANRLFSKWKTMNEHKFAGYFIPKYFGSVSDAEMHINYLKSKQEPELIKEL